LGIFGFLNLSWYFGEKIFGFGFRFVVPMWFGVIVLQLILGFDSVSNSDDLRFAGYIFFMYEFLFFLLRVSRYSKCWFGIPKVFS